MGSLAPKFGDVYRLSGDKLCVLFLRRQADGEWLGIPLNGPDNVLELYVAFDRGVWEFVETIDGHAAGTPLFTGWDPATGGVSAIATLMLHHIDGDPTNNDPANLRVEVLK